MRWFAVGFMKASPVGVDHISIPSGLTEVSKAPRKLVGTRAKRSVPALCESLMASKQRCVSDMG